MTNFNELSKARLEFRPNYKGDDWAILAGPDNSLVMTGQGWTRQVGFEIFETFANGRFIDTTENYVVGVSL